MDEYERLRVMGDGGQGKVYRVRHRKSLGEFALKVIPCRGGSQVNAALKEIKVLSQLRHRNVVSYVDFFLDFEQQDDGVCVCLVMELCEGGTVNDQIRDCKARFMESGAHAVREATAREWIRQCVAALLYIHGQGFLHRDVKPTNIFFGPGNTVKLGDFGLATAADPFGKASHVGTPHYLAPELLLRQPYDAKIDVWGLGVALAELLTLRDTPINTQVLQDPSAADAVVGDVVHMGFSTTMAALVRDMLQRHPQDRPDPAAILRRLEYDVPLTPAPGRGPPTPTPQRESASPFFSLSPIGVRTAASPPPPPRAAVAAAAVVCGEAPLCAMCGVFPSTVGCGDCGDSHCESCDAVKHRSMARRDHHRAPLRASGATPEPPLVPQDPNAPRAVEKAVEKVVAVEKAAEKVVLVEKVVERPPQPSSPSGGSGATVTLRVPQEYCSVASALAAAPPGSTISLAPGRYPGGFRVTVPSVSIVGGGDGDDRPCVEVADGATAVVLDAADCRLSKLRIVQAAPAVRGGTRPVGVQVVSGHPVVEHCDIRSTAYGITVTGAGVEPVVSHCTVHHCRQAGLLFDDASAGTVQDCEFAVNEYAGVLVKRRANPRLLGNVIKDCLHTGLYLHDCCGIFESNTITGNRGCGIVLKAGADPVVRRNRIAHSAHVGIFCCDKARGTITDNVITHSAKAGILIKAEAHPAVLRNTIVHGKEAGIYVFEHGQGLVEDNTISHNASSGLLVTSGGDPRVAGNTVRHNNFEGVWVCHGGHGVFQNNDLRSNRQGPRNLHDAGCGVRWADNIEQ